MSIELVSEADSGLLAFLHGRCFAEGWTADSFAALLKSGNVIAQAARNGESQPCGFIVVRIAADEAEILTLGILPEHRRAGLARALVLSAAEVAFAQGARTLFLEVNAGNAPALALYGRLGFVRAGRRAGYYRTCDSLADALVLRRALPMHGNPPAI